MQLRRARLLCAVPNRMRKHGNRTVTMEVVPTAGTIPFVFRPRKRNGEEKHSRKGKPTNSNSNVLQPVTGGDVFRIPGRFSVFDVRNERVGSFAICPSARVLERLAVAGRKCQQKSNQQQRRTHGCRLHCVRFRFRLCGKIQNTELVECLAETLVVEVDSGNVRVPFSLFS